MQWLLDNWIWVLLGGGMVAMHMFGHGKHGGGHGGGQGGGQGGDHGASSKASSGCGSGCGSDCGSNKTAEPDGAEQKKIAP